MINHSYLFLEISRIRGWLGREGNGEDFVRKEHLTRNKFKIPQLISHSIYREMSHFSSIASIRSYIRRQSNLRKVSVFSGFHDPRIGLQKYKTKFNINVSFRVESLEKKKRIIFRN